MISDCVISLIHVLSHSFIHSFPVHAWLWCLGIYAQKCFAPSCSSWVFEAHCLSCIWQDPRQSVHLVFSYITQWCSNLMHTANCWAIAVDLPSLCGTFVAVVTEDGCEWPCRAHFEMLIKALCCMAADLWLIALQGSWQDQRAFDSTHTWRYWLVEDCGPVLLWCASRDSGRIWGHDKRRVRLLNSLLSCFSSCPCIKVLLELKSCLQIDNRPCSPSNVSIARLAVEKTMILTLSIVLTCS